MIARLTMPKLLLLLIEVIAIAILGVVASSDFGFADGVRITLAYLVAYLVPRIVLERSRGNSTTAAVILFLLAVFLAFVGYQLLLLCTFFDDYSLQLPNLQGDQRMYYKWALHHFDGSVESQPVVFPGFPLMMIGLWKVLGVSVVWPQSMNIMFTLLSTVLMGLTTRRLLAGKVSSSPKVLVAGGMLLTGVLMYYQTMGVCILKEASTYLSIALTGFALSSMVTIDEERHRLWVDLLLFVLACLLMGLVRTTYMYFLFVGVIIVILPHWRRDWRMGLLMLLVAGVSLFLGNQLSAYSFDRHAEIVGGGWNMQRFYVISESQQFYHDLLNYYFLYSPWHKLLMLPLTMTVQFIIPLPWTYYDNPTTLSVLSRMTYGWYVVGGTALFYYLFLSWRSKDRLSIWTWWPVLCYMGISYIMAGSVARYIAPFQPLFAPVAVYVICRLVEGYNRKAFILWAVTFALLVTIALLFCLEVQQSTISRILHTQSLVHYIKSLGW